MVGGIGGKGVCLLLFFIRDKGQKEIVALQKLQLAGVPGPSELWDCARYAANSYKGRVKSSGNV